MRLHVGALDCDLAAVVIEKQLIALIMDLSSQLSQFDVLYAEARLLQVAGLCFIQPQQPQLGSYGMRTQHWQILVLYPLRSSWIRPQINQSMTLQMRN